MQNKRKTQAAIYNFKELKINTGARCCYQHRDLDNEIYFFFVKSSYNIFFFSFSLFSVRASFCKNQVKGYRHSPCPRVILVRIKRIQMLQHDFCVCAYKETRKEDV